MPPESKPEARPVPGPLEPGPAIRGLWVDAFGPGFKTPVEVDQLIRDAQAMNINTLFVQAVKRGDCYCGGSLLPRTEDPAVPADFDPLADVLEKAHAQHIKVHAWVIPTAVASRAVQYPVTNPEHIANAHGEGSESDWLTRSASGVIWAGNDQQLDLGNPDALRYIVEGVRSLAAAYPVDGIQLDRVRYPDPLGKVQDWGYNPGALAAYQAESGTTDTPDPEDAAWMAWRRGRVDALVHQVSEAVRAARPGTTMSVAAITYGAGPKNREDFTHTRTYAEVFQDWPAWLSGGDTDLVVMMNYKREARVDQARAFDVWNRFAQLVKGDGQVAAGTALYLNTAAENLAQARRVVEQGLDGWVGYSYRTPELGVEDGSKDGGKAYRELSNLLVGEPGQSSPDGR
ncbi:glycoside hydrolase family 10 protein [Deinococcus hopiensis]|uniref:glycoside hydrolase family 10 protein n=1 Tax=Deinococcus hopiensis TaxID=309885 RepID=UPI001FE5E218|nr:family 10 glycosylhydrolase [Deinococcus hopiensis]